MWALQSEISRIPLSFAAPCLGNPCEYSTNLIETRIIDLHFTSDSTNWSIFIQIFLGGLRRTIFLQKCVSAVQGHPRLLILVRIESAYATSYWSVIVSLVLSCIVSEILQVFRAHDPTLIPPQFWGCSLCTRSHMLGSVWAGTLSYSGVNFRGIPTYVITVRERHRRTDGQTDDILWHNRALCSIAR